MRIISGTHKGRRFEPPAFMARPTTDFAKENIFNVLQNMLDFEDLDCLDLFSGTGSISYELASRGAKSVTSIEVNVKHQQYILKQIKEFGFQDIITSLRQDAFDFCKRTKRQYGFIFADAPFDHPKINLLPDHILASGALDPDGLLVIEHSEANRFEGHPNLMQVRSYGKVNFSLFQHSTLTDSSTASSTDIEI